ncbi:hypothetical protein KCU77_g94, partial [Aureobasidium melanogenum]
MAISRAYKAVFPNSANPCSAAKHLLLELQAKIMDPRQINREIGQSKMTLSSRKPDHCSFGYCRWRHGVLEDVK